jgi:radical SAM enzyme, Cfr family
VSRNNIITAEDIYNDPFGYTYEEYSKVLGEETASEFFANLYSNSKKTKYRTIKTKEILRGHDTNKYAFELNDGYCIETVCIKRRTGTTVCVSTMVGCPVGCVFCASGENGFIRNLTPSEIVQQVIFVEEKVNRIVYMGMGEPLLNYDNVIKSIHILRDRNGLDFPTDGITISTVGPLNQLKKLREEHLKIHLTLSLHATNQTTRNRILPHMKSYKIGDVVQSVLAYSERHNRMVTIAYLLIPGQNDHLSDVKQLGQWFRNKNVLINLLQYNETDYQGIRRPNKQELVAFRDKLNGVGLTVKIRESRGGKIKAACGQLVSKRNRRSDNRKDTNRVYTNKKNKTNHISKTKRVKSKPNEH